MNIRQLLRGKPWEWHPVSAVLTLHVTLCGVDNVTEHLVDTRLWWQKITTSAAYQSAFLVALATTVVTRAIYRCDLILPMSSRVTRGIVELNARLNAFSTRYLEVGRFLPFPRISWFVSPIHPRFTFTWNPWTVYISWSQDTFFQSKRSRVKRDGVRRWREAGQELYKHTQITCKR